VYLFDASAIVNLVKKASLTAFAEGVTLDLALYESLNAVWKEYRLLKRIDEDTALKLAEIISDLFKVIKTLSIKGSEREILSLASREGTTVYDASYLYTALKNNLILVTDDRKLKEKASRHVKVLTSSQLATTR